MNKCVSAGGKASLSVRTRAATDGVSMRAPASVSTAAADVTGAKQLQQLQQKPVDSTPPAVP